MLSFHLRIETLFYVIKVKSVEIHYTYVCERKTKIWIPAYYKSCRPFHVDWILARSNLSRFVVKYINSNKKSENIKKRHISGVDCTLLIWNEGRFSFYVSSPFAWDWWEGPISIQLEIIVKLNVHNKVISFNTPLSLKINCGIVVDKH